MSARDEEFEPETVIRAWCLALRDLCEQGAESAMVGMPGGGTITYTPGQGATVLAGGRKLRIPDDALDNHGLVPA